MKTTKAAERLKEYLEETNTTVTEFAKQVGMTKQTVSLVTSERLSRPNRAHIKAFNEKLGLDDPYEVIDV